MNKRILFLLCDACICGGTYVILEHASRLSKMGYDVSIGLVYMKMDVFATFQQPPQDWHPALKTLRFLYWEDALTETFDIAIFTLWSTVYLIDRIPATHKIYFVQSIESRFFPREHTFARQQVLKTYSLGLPVITEATWIQTFLETHFPCKTRLVRNGINKTIYTEQGEKVAEKPAKGLRILVEGPLNAPFKNVARTIELCKAANVGEIWLLTSSVCSSHVNVDRVFSKVSVSERARIYRACDVLVKLSYVEGMFGPPLEMFHCGGTAIVYDVTGHDEYIAHHENALVAKTGDEQAVIGYLQQLNEDRALLSKLKQGALNTAQQWIAWDAAAQQFSEALASLTTLPLKPPSSERLTENLPVKIHVAQKTAQTEFLLHPVNQKPTTLSALIPIFPGNITLELCFGERYEKFLLSQLRFIPLQDTLQHPTVSTHLNHLMVNEHALFQSLSPQASYHLTIETPSTLDQTKPCFYLQIEIMPLTISAALSEVLAF